MRFPAKFLACWGVLLIFLAATTVTSAQNTSTSRKRIPQDPEAAALNNLLTQAQAAMDRKDYEAAVQAYRQFLAKRPDDATVHYDLGYAYTALQKPADAKAEYEKTISLDPKMASAYQNLGLTLLATDPSSAVAPLRKAVELLPEDTRAKFLLGSALELSGKTAPAIEQYQAAQKLGENDFDIHFALGRALLSSNQVAAAEGEFRAALALKPDSPAAHLGVAKSLVAQKKSEAAAAEYFAYLVAQPSDNSARLERAEALVDVGKYDDALAELDRAATTGPESLRALKLRAQIAFQTKHYDAALLALQKAIALAPRDPDLAAQLGHIYLEKKDYPQAVNQLIVAFKMNPASNDVLGDLITAQYLNKNYPATLQGLDVLSQRETLPLASWFIRAACYDKLGQQLQALDAYKKFLELNKDQNNDMYFEASARVRTLTREIKKK
ncbi:MAG: tetratricopeptide repeat protein [Candidatus Acidiferrales bacterium]